MTHHTARPVPARRLFSGFDADFGPYNCHPMDPRYDGPVMCCDCMGERVNSDGEPCECCCGSGMLTEDGTPYEPAEQNDYADWRGEPIND